MTKFCQNCNSELNGNYCSQCGQSSTTHRINFRFLWHDIQHGLLHVDKGIFYTTKELFTRPGHSIRDFLNGKRVQHFKPTSLVLVLAGIYGLLSHYFNINLLSNNIEVSGTGADLIKAKASLDQMSEWIAQHYSILALLQIPIFSVGTFFCFKKFGYNSMEHLVINTFISGQKLIIHIAAFPFYYLFNHSDLLKPTARITDFIGYAIALWTVFQLFNDLNTFSRIWRTLLSLIISLIIIFIILMVVSLSILR